MDIDEFAKTQKPVGNRSKLEPFRTQIAELKSMNYSQQQIVEFLQLNGVTVSLNGLRLFLAKINKQPAPPQSSTAIPNTTTETTAAKLDEFAGLTEKQRREKLGDKYIGNTGRNPLLERIIKDKK
jgi:hypothetical protein